MSKRQKKLLVSGAAILALLFLTLVIHIIIVTKPGDGYHAAIQLGRIDFPKTLSTGERTEAMQSIRAIEGIGIAKMNTEGTALVYSFPTGSLTCAQVFNEFQSRITFPASQYIAPDQTVASGCPIHDKTSLAYRFSTFIRNTFHH